MADNHDRKLHIVMFPWLAFGHMIPFLELSKLFAQKGHIISFVSTPKNILRLPKLPPTFSTLINFVQLPLPQVPDLPQDAESTADITVKHLCLLEKAYDLLEEPFTQFLQASQPDWVLFDFVSIWVPAAAHKLSIPTAYFSIFTASCITYLSSPSGEEDPRQSVEEFAVAPKWVPFPSTVAYRHFEISRTLTLLLGDETRHGALYRFRESTKNCDIIAVRTCVELEQEWLQVLEQIHRKPSLAIGTLPTNLWCASDDEHERNSEWQPIKDWLDKQGKGSVVYVAFGTESSPTQEELYEIAHGLELAGLPFFWVLRKRSGIADAEEMKLPDGYLDRIKGRGVICRKWAPQLKILAHEAIGGFLTHSGWSSVVEALQFERPLVLLPLGNDQGLNAKLLEEKKMGYLLPRNEYDGWFTREAVAESLRMVIVAEEGKIYREKAKEMKGLLGDLKKQEMYVENFLRHIRNFTWNR